MAAPTIQSPQITPFPLGLSSFGMPVVGGGAVMTTGRVFFVDSTAAGAGNDSLHGTGPATPFLTLAFAIGQCGANRGDVIFILPGHLETVLSAAGINLNVAGVTIIGISPGGGRDRPKFTLSTSTAASIDVNAANIRLSNVVIDATGIDAVIAAINVKGADFTLDSSELIVANAAGQALKAILTDANASRLKVIRNFFNGTADAGADKIIDLNGAGTLADVDIRDNRFVGNATFFLFNTAGATCSDLLIRNNTFICLGVLNTAISIGEVASRGIIADNYVAITSGVLDTAIVPGTLSTVNNWGFTPTGSNPAQIIPPVGAQLPTNSSLVDQIVSNLSGSRANYIKVVVDFSQVAWNTVATHRIIVAIGAGVVNHVRILPVCRTDLTSGGAAQISFGTTSDTARAIANTLATDIDATEIWLDTTPAKAYLISGKGTTPGKFIDILADEDIGFQITVAALTGGIIDFHCWVENTNGLPFTTSNLLLFVGTGSVMA